MYVLEVSASSFIHEMFTVSCPALLASSIVAFCSSSALASKRLDLLEDIRHSYRIPSLGVAKVTNGSLYSETTGYRKWGNDTKVTDQDKWHLGSLTKSMTATVFAILIEEGVLGWDTLLKDAVAPDLAPKVHPDYANVTLDMLTTHTSGIDQSAQYSNDFMEEMWDPKLPPVQGRFEWAQHSLSRPAEDLPGTRFKYSNTGYIILGHIMEYTMNKSWENLMIEKVWSPLGMDGCGFGVAPEPHPGAIEQPWPHRLFNETDVVSIDPFDRYADNPMAMAPSGQVHCTLESWSKFLNMHMRGHNGKAVPIPLTQDSFIKLHTPRLDNYAYGGWGVTRRPWAGGGRNLVLQHTGSNLLNFAVARLDVEDERAYVSVTNSADQDSNADDPTRAADATDSAILAVINGRLLSSSQGRTIVLSPGGVGLNEDNSNRHDEFMRTKGYGQVVLPSSLKHG